MQVISFSQKEGFAVIEEPTLDVDADVNDDVSDAEFYGNRKFTKYDWDPKLAREDVTPVMTFYTRQLGLDCPWEFLAVLEGNLGDSIIVTKSKAEELALRIALAPLCQSQQLDSLLSDAADHVKAITTQIQLLNLG